MGEAVAMTLRQQQGVESRERILDAAVQVIYERGYSGTSVSEIRKRSGLPVSSIYWHFGNKDGVIGAVLQREAARFFASLPEMPPSPGLDPVEEFTTFMASVGDSVKDGTFFQVLVTLALETADSSEEVLSSIRAIREDGLRFLLAPVSRVCAALGSTRDPREISAFCLSVLDGAVIARRVDPDDGAPATTFRQLAIAVLALARTPDR